MREGKETCRIIWWRSCAQLHKVGLAKKGDDTDRRDRTVPTNGTQSPQEESGHSCKHAICVNIY
uniref:Uncharacterized protein n=1 Tax=Heterorhabditis bacteriophora TaxID=37862 RepID=A0A1I7XCC9_HETBA